MIVICRAVYTFFRIALEMEEKKAAAHSAE
jgi:hypothetical protein